MPTVALLVGRSPSDRYSLHRGYADAVAALGATPVVLVPPPTTAGVHGYVDAALRCDAVCATGGGDVAPARYGGSDGDGLMDIDPMRDEAELACIRACVGAGVPVLGICRGIQVLAVAMGGALVPDLGRAGFAGHWDEERQHMPVHAVSVARGSSAEVALGGATAVNSIHHQAVAAPGPSLAVTATAPGGVVEAVEAPGVLGIQWHPERLVASGPAHLAPFRWLMSTTGARA